MSGQGWNRAEWRCGRCWASITTTTELDYIKRVQAHRDAHALWDSLDAAGRRAVLAALGEVTA